MNVIPNSKEEELLLRMFKHIKKIHFIDFKDKHWSFIRYKCFTQNVQLENNLIYDIANFIQNRYPEFYHSQRRKLEDHSHYLSTTKSE
jgi:hypothetical protein